MADKQMNQFTTATDGAYIYAEAADGSQVKIAKEDLFKTIVHDRNKSLNSTHDLNDINTPGCYGISGDSSGIPANCPVAGKAMLVVFVALGWIVAQTLIAFDSKALTRIYWGGSGWSSWK